MLIHRLIVHRPSQWALLALACVGIAASTPPIADKDASNDRQRAAIAADRKNTPSRAASATAEEKRLSATSAATARALRVLENAAAAATDRVAYLVQRRAETQQHLAEHAASMAPFLPIIQRLAIYPTETLLAVPLPAEDTVRGILVLSGLTHQLEAQAESLRIEEAQLASLQTQIDTASLELSARQADQGAQAALIDAQLKEAKAQRRNAESATNGWTVQAAEEAARAENVRSAIRKLETDRAVANAAQATAPKPRQEIVTATNAAPVSGSFNALSIPVAGSISHQFGEALDGGPASGISYQPPPAARVAAPCTGRVVFAGPFRSFGNLMIIDCGSQYHVVMSGFEHMDAQLGQSVSASEPVGAMPNWDPLSPQNRPSLQLELRHDGEPTNPAPFLHAAS